jgi:hypothetical protein
MRLLAFVLALLLLAGSVDPTRGWLITLVVLTGLAALRPRFWNWLDMRLAIDARLAAFVLACLLLAGTIDPTKDWLIALSAVTGVAAFMPRVFAADLFGFNGGRDSGRRWACGPAFRWDNDDWAGRLDRKWARFDRRMDRRSRRQSGNWGDDWS